MPASMEEKIEELRKRRQHILQGGGPDKLDKHRASGKLTARERIDALAEYGKVCYANVMVSGAVPQVALVCGPCAGGAAYSPALTDFIIQTRQAQMFITGPQVIRQVTGENITAEELGGPDAHMTQSGV